uniref:Uncharacterized protein n=1 Tax=Arundo donax TaxID=35708 RepID=A0A0A9BX32_ARUDO
MTPLFPVNSGGQQVAQWSSGTSELLFFFAGSTSCAVEFRNFISQVEPDCF